MESKLATIVARRSNLLFSRTNRDIATFLRRGISSVPHIDREKTKKLYEAEEYLSSKEDNNNTQVVNPKGTEALKNKGVNKAPHHSFPTLESTVVHNPADPTHLQRRNYGHRDDPPLQLVCSAGVEAPPSRDDDDDDFGFYLRHKASPLSEIEFVDTRKPITQATSSNVSVGKEVVGWLPEQMLSAEETMLRAAQLWRLRAMRGDPDSPHGRVLRTLRNEWF